MLKDLLPGDQLPQGISQRDLRSVTVTFRRLSDQRACHAGLTAVGTSSGDAASIVNDLTEVVTGIGGVSLPGALHGRMVMIKNAGAGTITIYPVSTDRIDALTTAQGYSLSASGFVSMVSIKDGQWYSK